MMAKRSPLGSQEKSVTVSAYEGGEIRDAYTGTKRTFQLDDFDREVLLAYAEDLEIAEDRLLRFSVTVHLDA